MTIDAPLIISVCSLAITIFGLVWFGGVKLGQIEVKVDTMWEFQMRRGESELVTRGFGRKKSPLVVSKEAMDLYNNGIAPELQKFYKELPHKNKITDNDLALKIENKFGERILTEVAIPNKLNLGGCLLIAVAVAKSKDVIELEHHDNNN
jgi:hypothetical protein